MLVFFIFFFKKIIFLISTNQTYFLFQKQKKIVFSLYSQKQGFESRKQKQLPIITLTEKKNKNFNCFYQKKKKEKKKDLVLYHIFLKMQLFQKVTLEKAKPKSTWLKLQVGLYQTCDGKNGFSRKMDRINNELHHFCFLLYPC